MPESFCLDSHKSLYDLSKGLLCIKGVQDLLFLNRVPRRHKHILGDSDLLGSIRSVRGCNGIFIYIGAVTIAAFTKAMKHFITARIL